MGMNFAELKRALSAASLRESEKETLLQLVTSQKDDAERRCNELSAEMSRLQIVFHDYEQRHANLEAKSEKAQQELADEVARFEARLASRVQAKDSKMSNSSALKELDELRAKQRESAEAVRLATSKLASAAARIDELEQESAALSRLNADLHARVRREAQCRVEAEGAQPPVHRGGHLDRRVEPRVEQVAAQPTGRSLKGAPSARGAPSVRAAHSRFSAT